MDCGRVDDCKVDWRGPMLYNEDATVGHYGVVGLAPCHRQNKKSERLQFKTNRCGVVGLTPCH